MKTSSRARGTFDVPRLRTKKTALALALAGAFAAGAAWAADDQPAAQALERVQVTGSRLRRIEAETALPVQVIRREDIDNSGAQSVEQLLSQITGGSAFREAISIGSDARAGYSGVSLRSLGTNETLVLLDGRRLANYALSEQSGVAVDLHAIPLEAIERVEVLLDGASAIYGSDAIGGVVNFILKKNFHGVAASAYRGGTQGGGASDTRATLVAGAGDPEADGYNLFGVLDWQKKGSLAARERSYTATAYQPANGIDSTSSGSFPANIRVKGGFKNPAAPACTDLTVFKNGGCYFDYERIAAILPSTEQASLLLRAVKRFGDQEVYAEGLYDQSRVRAKIAPTPVTLTSGDPITLPASSPFYPQGLGLHGDLTDLRYRTLPLGPRVSQSTADQSRVLVGLRGSVADWDYDGALIFNDSHAVNRFVSGYLGAQKISDALLTGLVNPFGDSGPAGDALLASTVTSGVARRATGVTRGFDAHATRDLFSLPAGPVGLALGVEGRRESLDDVSEDIALDAVGGGTRAPKAGTRTVESAFVELGVPIVKHLDMQFAGRFDYYSDFGSTFNPKVSLRWQPAREVLFRAAYNRGFRAPSLPELFTAGTVSIDYVTDPVRCPVTGSDDDCANGRLVNLHSGGNPALRPERSEETTGGIVFQPNDHWSGSLDFWKVRLSNTILPLTIEYTLANDARYEGTNIVRGPADPANPGLPGPITDVYLLNQNVGATRTHGVDVQAVWRSGSTASGAFSIKVSGTYTQEYKSQLASEVYTNFLAEYSNGTAVPRWKQYLAFDWTVGPWVAAIHEAGQTGYKDANPDANGNPRTVGSSDVWGIQGSVTTFRHATLTVGIENVFNRAPPFSNQTDYSGRGYNPSIDDPRGRFWYAKLGVRFP